MRPRISEARKLVKKEQRSLQRLEPVFDEPRISFDGLLARGWVPHEIDQLKPISATGGRKIYAMSAAVAFEERAFRKAGPASRPPALPEPIPTSKPAPRAAPEPVQLDPEPVAVIDDRAEILEDQRQRRLARDAEIAASKSSPVPAELRGTHEPATPPQREAPMQHVDAAPAQTTPEPTPAPAAPVAPPRRLSPDDDDYEWFAARPNAEFRVRAGIPPEHVPQGVKVICRALRLGRVERVSRRPFVVSDLSPAALLDLSALWDLTGLYPDLSDRRT
ncbi:MAG TPA: hypothetical protein VM689_11650 [Aliidongia sp.]|nr:hypothetical protein [Aliidongia sp.]